MDYAGTFRAARDRERWAVIVRAAVDTSRLWPMDYQNLNRSCKQAYACTYAMYRYKQVSTIMWLRFEHWTY